MQWMAPEVLRGTGAHSCAADVYSLGVVLWEIAALAHPYEGVPHARLLHLLLARRARPPMPHDAPTAYASLVRACWAEAEAERPCAGDVLVALRGMRASELEDEAARARCAARDAWWSVVGGSDGDDGVDGDCDDFA